MWSREQYENRIADLEQIVDNVNKALVTLEVVLDDDTDPKIRRAFDDLVQAVSGR